jgi:hypothetical protein
LAYAFIVNRESLSFCFQASALEFGKHDFDELQALLIEFNQNNLVSDLLASRGCPESIS